MLTSRLIEALAYSDRPGASPLQSRMDRCGGEHWNFNFTCRTPGCRTCRNRYIGRQRIAAEKRFGALGNEQLASLSLVVGATQTLRDIEVIWTKFRKDLRNLIDSQRRQNGLWALTEALVWLEVDAISGEDFMHLAPNKMAQLGELAPFAFYTGQPVWVVTCHGIIAHPGLPLERVRSQLERQWPGYRQTCLKPFDDQNSVVGNIGGVVNYALKNECRVHLGYVSEAWPTSWAADYYAYLHEWSRGFQSLRISVGRLNRTSKTSNTPSRPKVNASTSEGEMNNAMPMMIDYSVFHTPYNWSTSDENRGYYTNTSIPSCHNSAREAHQLASALQDRHPDKPGGP